MARKALQSLPTNQGSSYLHTPHFQPSYLPLTLQLRKPLRSDGRSLGQLLHYGYCLILQYANHFLLFPLSTRFSISFPSMHPICRFPLFSNAKDCVKRSFLPRKQPLLRQEEPDLEFAAYPNQSHSTVLVRLFPHFFRF